MKPYYDEAGIQIYHGDCREILPQLENHPDTCIVDPVWPNSVFPNVKDPQLLFKEMCDVLRSSRLVVHLGCNSDPRFLISVPQRFKYLRTCWLRYACPSYRGRILNGSDVAYAFGEAPSSIPGRQVLSGEVTAKNNSTKLQHTARGNGNSDNINYDDLPHPCPRRLEHLTWLCKVFVDNSIIDPFCGSGTTLHAAKEMCLTAIGIEIEERYCAIAAERLQQEVLPL